MRFDRLRIEALLPDALDEDRRRDLARAEAGHLHAIREIVCGVLDRVMHFARRNLDDEADAIPLEPLDLCLHRRAIESGTSGLARVLHG